MGDRTAVADHGRLTHPSYFIIFGSFRAIRWPSDPTVVPHWISLGTDILTDMEPPNLMPAWPYNEDGSAFVPHLGNVAMKHVDFQRLASHSFMTSIWLGTATPSKKRQEKELNRSRGKGRQRKGEGYHSGRKGGAVAEAVA